MKNIRSLVVIGSLVWLWCFAPRITLSQPETNVTKVPLAGNCYRLAPASEPQALRRDGSLRWSQPEEVFGVFFHVDQATKLSLGITGRQVGGESQLEITMDDQSAQVSMANQDWQLNPVGDFEVHQPGYVCIKMKGLRRQGDHYGELKELNVHCQNAQAKVTCVATNEGNMFYWGRRGPSVHLSYELPRDKKIEYGYSEILVEPGDDPLGSYFMANGFAEGYFGIQVNSATERRVLFSVWSPFQTDNPREIPEDQRIKLLAKGPDVKTGEFGNEGSGGQSYLVYPWEAGRVYRFLTQVKPNGDGTTTYTSWFGDVAENQWRLIASFQRPKTETHLRGFHSFLENFNPATGHQSRRGNHQHIWVCDTQGQWHACVRARFSVDATGGGGHRLDFRGGVAGGRFYLQNCGFFAESLAPNTRLELTAPPTSPPTIQFDQLPRE